MSDAKPVHTVYLSLGSNLGDRRLNLQEAVERLNNHPEIRVTRVSSVNETAAVGYTDQPDFFNIAAEVKTTLSPENLYKMTSSTELELGRQREIKWGPRTLDIDILLIDKQVMDTAELTIPHPRMTERAFVLLPLAELAGDFVHPVTLETVSAMANQVDGKEGVFRCQIQLASDYEPTEN